MDYIYGTLGEDPCDEDTREFVCGISMEALLSQFDVDGAVVCDSLFALLDDIVKQQQQQGDITTATPPIASPPRKTKIRPDTKKTHK